MRRRTWFVVAVGVVLAITTYRVVKIHFPYVRAESLKPERTVKGNVLESARDPKVRLEFSPPIDYVGADRWVLYGVADCEVHVFVEADPEKKVRRLYWVQFEGYLPEVKSSYKYDSKVEVTLGGLKFLVDGGVGRTDEPTRSGSDTEHVRELVRARGYRFPAEMMFKRLVHLPDAEKRKELMIIYSEDFAASGYTWDDLKEGGPKVSEKPALSKALQERALAGIKLTQ